MRCAFSARLPPLAAGAFGFISYDAVRLLEDIPNQHPDLDSLPDILFQFYETSLVFNHFKETITISVIVDPGTNLKESFYTAKSRLESIIAQISEIPIDEHLHFPPLPVQSDLSDEDFSRIVDQAKKHLLLGDVFRIVLSRKFAQPVSTTPIEIYRILRRLNPAPFLYYFQEKDYAIIGASFERLARLQNGIVDTMPIAPANPTERELREHVMQVDLARSDIGKVCQPGSVLVNEFKATKPFGDRNFLVSTIEGTLKANVDAIDVLKAVFPSGSLSGVPKIRAMEIIDALETSRRGLYGGAICMIDSMGNLDSCLATGTAIIKNGVATIRAGTGVLLDSDTDAKTQKTLHQAKGMLEAVRLAEEVIR
jgi:anthranilate synthase component 1